MPSVKGKGNGGRRNEQAAENGKQVGRPRVYATFKRDERLIVERAPIGGVGTTEVGTVLSVSAHEVEIQIGDDILVIRRPDANLEG
jgi:hypothetical protein